MPSEPSRAPSLHRQATHTHGMHVHARADSSAALGSTAPQDLMLAAAKQLHGEGGGVCGGVSGGEDHAVRCAVTGGAVGSAGRRNGSRLQGESGVLLAVGCCVLGRGMARSRGRAIIFKATHGTQLVWALARRC